jgi:hypothetical protein
VRYCLAKIRPAMRADVAQRRSSAEQLVQLGLPLLCNDAASYGLSACSVTSYERTQGSSRCCPPPYNDADSYVRRRKEAARYAGVRADVSRVHPRDGPRHR